MSSKKLFESDISRSLTALGLWYYKPIDIVQAGQDKVDYFLNFRGRFCALEVKQVTGGSCPPSDFSKGQKLCLSSVARSDGLALVVVNFHRVRPSRGTAYLYLVREVAASFKEGLGFHVQPVPPGKWDLLPALTWAASSKPLVTT